MLSLTWELRGVFHRLLHTVAIGHTGSFRHAECLLAAYIERSGSRRRSGEEVWKVSDRRMRYLGGRRYRASRYAKDSLPTARKTDGANVIESQAVDRASKPFGLRRYSALARLPC